MKIETSLSKYLVFCAVGFGLGGLLWGGVLYGALPDLEYPFHYLAIIIMSLFGGTCLSIFSKNIKQILKTILAGFLGFTIGFVGVAVFSYYLYLYGVFLLLPIDYLIRIEILNKFINLDPNIGLGSFWLLFLFIGAIIGLFYALFLKTKIWSLIWRGGVGFALGSLIGPILGNITGNLFNSLLVSYLMTFSLVGIILGLFLSWGVYMHKR